MAGYNIKKLPDGFPSPFVSPQEKSTKEYSLCHARAFDRQFTSGGGNILRFATVKYKKNRSYASGEQPIDQYKEMLGVQKRKDKKDLSWRNLDWSIFPVLPTLVSVVKNKVLGQQKDILIKAIDPLSQNEDRVRKNEIVTYMLMTALSQKAKESFGIDVPSPLGEGEPQPANMQEIEMHMQMFPKDRYILELYDQISRVKSLNSWSEIWDQVVEDLIAVGVGGTKCYIDYNGLVRVRAVVPENIITNNCTKKDFSDLTRVAEYIPMSIAELRCMVPKGMFSEEDYINMVSKSSGTQYSLMGLDAYFKANYRYPYDHEKVMVMDTEYISSDDIAYVVSYSNSGNMNIEKMKNPYWLNNVKVKDERGAITKTGVTDDEYVNFYKQKGESREIIRDGVENLYGYKWVVGTDYIFDFGPKANVQRSVSRLGACKTNYNLYTFFSSYMDKAEPVADQIQLNWLQHQNHIAKSKPDGLKIDKRALTTLSVGGKGGIELNELEVLQMYAETGNMVYKGVDAAGRPYMVDPIQVIKGGISEAAQQHLDFIIQHIDFLRHIFGLNQATDSSTPNPKLGKAIAQMLEQNTNTALGSVYHAYSKLFEDTVNSIALLIPDAEMIKNSSKDEGLGESSGIFFRTNSDTTFREMAITIEDGPTDEERQNMREALNAAVANGEIRAGDVYLIMKESNPMRAFYMLEMRKRQKMEEDAQAQERTFQAEDQKNINSAKVAGQIKTEGELAVVNAETEAEMALHPLKMEEIAMQGVINAIIQKMKDGTELNKQDKEHVQKAMETMMKTRSQEKIAKMKPKPKPAAKKK